MREVKKKRKEDVTSHLRQEMTGTPLRKGRREGREKYGEREKERVTMKMTQNSRPDGAAE